MAHDASEASTFLPPGTVQILRVHGELSADEIVLVPKPSDHPDDPLNWSKFRKLVHVLNIYLYVFTVGIGATCTYSYFVDISKDTGITLTQLNLGTGFIFLLAGWGNLLWQPLALSVGRRPAYLLSLISIAAVTEGTAWVTNFPQWAAVRILYGFLVAPVETLPEVSIPDVYFAHERGAYIGVYSLVLSGSNFIAPLIAGFMNEAVGWRWVQHWAALLILANFIISYFTLEESMYFRGTVEADVSAELVEVPRPAGSLENGDEPKDKTQTPVQGTASQIPGQSTEVRRKTYKEKLALFSPTHLTLKQCFTTSWRPILIFFQFPNITWAGIQYGFTNAWYSVYNATASAILSAPPYNLNSGMVGVTYLAPLVGAAIGAYVSGPLSDKMVLRLAHRAGGLREPEHRLWGLLSYAIILPIGLLLWGIGAAHQTSLAVLLVGSVFCGYGIIAGGSYAISYNVDSFKEIAGESLVSLILCRNTMTFAFSYAITPWINASGLQNTFIAVGVIAFVSGMMVLPMIWKGKALRIKSAPRYWRYAADQMIAH